MFKKNDLINSFEELHEKHALENFQCKKLRIIGGCNWLTV